MLLTLRYGLFNEGKEILTSLYMWDKHAKYTKAEILLHLDRSSVHNISSIYIHILDSICQIFKYKLYRKINLRTIVLFDKFNFNIFKEYLH